MHSPNCRKASIVRGRGLICVRRRCRLNGLSLMCSWCTSIKLNAALFDPQNDVLAILCSYITFNSCSRWNPRHRLMCLTSHWARKCINCYSKQRAILGALVQKIKHFSFSFFSPSMCCWTQPVLDQKARLSGGGLCGSARAASAQKATAIWWRPNQRNGTTIQLAVQSRSA